MEDFERLKAPAATQVEQTGATRFKNDIEVKQMEEGIFVSQERYAKEVLEKFNMINSKPVTTPIEVGVKLSKHE